jgi:hypothetical protein
MSASRLKNIFPYMLKPGSMKIPMSILLLCQFFMMPAFAQTDVYNNGQLFLSNSTDTLYITGSLNNNAGATLLNSGGNIYVLGDLVNAQTGMLAGGGKLWFTGTALQNISGTQPFRTDNWIVNNSAGVVLQNRIGVGNGSGGALSFVNGFITSGTQTQDVYFYPGSSYTGFTGNTHIIGYCTKSGSTDFTYPIGNGTLKADLDIINLSATADFQCKYFGSGYGVYIPQTPLISIFEKEYWTLDRNSGIAAAQITLKWNDARRALNHTAPADLRVGHFTGSNWISEGGTGSVNAVEGTVTSVPVSSFSPFTFSSVGVALPVKISSFNASVNSNNCRVTVGWVSEDETEVAKYTLQKSSNGLEWENVTGLAVNTAVNTSVQRTLTDDITVNGNWMYRIKVEHKTGSFFYTTTKMLSLHCSQAGIKVYPTVTNSSFNVSIPMDTPLKEILVLNNRGQVIKKSRHTGQLVTNISLSGFAAGAYTVLIVPSSGKPASFKIIKTE